ncbi:MAG: metallophosphoesterase family protein [Oscillospiraceae bacterium]|nr:metallophosphoesterase family protein [Oscillospiraceae bacterium]
MLGAIKLIIMSDSHGDFRSTNQIIQRHINEKCIFLHLGDGARDVEDLRMLYPNIDLRSVSGNCDFYSMDPTEAELCHGDKRCFSPTDTPTE